MVKKLNLTLLFLLLTCTVHATVTNTTFSITYSCSGSSGPFSFNFPISDAATVQVPASLIVTQNGTVLTSGQYTVSPVNNNYENGGAVTLTTACPAAQILVLTRSTPLTQATQFYDNMPAPLTQTMYGLDKLTEITQEQAASLWLPVYVSTPPSGSCSNYNQVAYYFPNGGSAYQTYICPDGTWVLSGVAAGTGCAGGNTIANGCTGANTQLSAQGTLGIDSVQNIVDYGATIDGATDIGPAVQDAVNSCPNQSTGTNGSSCVVLLPCGGPLGCYWATNTAPQAAGSVKLVVKIQGFLKGNDTIDIEPDTLFEGDGGGVPGSYQTQGPTANIESVQTAGTLGTAISTTGSPVNFTPTFTTGASSSISSHSAITVIDPESETISGTITSTPFTAGTYNVTATLPSYWRLPEGAVVNITGCANSAYDANGVTIIYSDFPSGNIGWGNSSVGSGTTTGCTLAGYNYDTWETTHITSFSAGVATATFAHQHSASAVWGQVGVMFANSGCCGGQLNDIQVSGALGAEIYAGTVSGLYMNNDAMQSTFSVTSIPMEAEINLAGISNTSFLGVGSMSPPSGCVSGCSEPSYPMGSLKCTYLIGDITNQDGCSNTIMANDVFILGIEVDSALQSTDSMAVPFLYNSYSREQPYGMVNIDNRYSPVTSGIVMASPSTQDAGGFIGFPNSSYVWCTDSGYYSLGANEIQLSNPLGSITPNIINSYCIAKIGANNSLNFNIPYGTRAPSPTMEVGGQTITENMGDGAGFGPRVVPWPTQPISAITSGSCSSGCSVTSVPGPDGNGNDAVELDSTASGGGSAYAGQVNISTYAGDCFLFGAQVRQGANQRYLDGPGGFPIYVKDFGTGAISYINTGIYDPQIGYEGWHHYAGEGCVTTGEATSHIIRLIFYSGPNTGQGNQFFGWWWMFIPGPNNPSYTGWPAQDEVERWRRDLLHGAIPANWNAPGVAVTTYAINAATLGTPMVSTSSITGPVPVKADTSNAGQVVVTTTSDTGAGIVLGICTNSPAAGQPCNVVSNGTVALTMGTGTCSIGNFAIVDTTSNGDVKCTGTYTAGEIIGTAVSAQVTVGDAVNVQLRLR